MTFQMFRSLVAGLRVPLRAVPQTRHNSTLAAARPVRRSILYMPAFRERNLKKAKALPADGLILDLEDAVPVQMKELARDMAKVAAGEYPDKEVVIRVNSVDTPWFEQDVVAVRDSAANGILLPKVESVDMVEKLASLSGSMPIWCMIETPLGVLNAAQIAFHPLVECLVVGTEDLKAELECAVTPDRAPLRYALQQVVLSARAAGISAIDGVHVALDDDEGFLKECKQGAEFGFDGKTLLHPKTVAVANKVFSPSEEEVVKAKELLDHFESAGDTDEVGAKSFNGRLVEALHLKRAARILALAEAMNKSN